MAQVQDLAVRVKRRAKIVETAARNAHDALNWSDDCVSDEERAAVDAWWSANGPNKAAQLHP